MKKIVTWWNNQFESNLEAKIWFLIPAILISLSVLVSVLNQLGVNTIIFH